jgi:Tfp pilus assembly protein PilE
VKIFDEKGVTLTELLMTITIMMIVLPIIYGLFTTGYKLYHKIQIEGQLRDDADYAATMIMNQFYSFPFDYIKLDNSHSIKLVNNQYTSIIEKETDNQTFYSINQEEEYDPTMVETLTISLKEKDGKTKVEINGQALDTLADFAQSSINYSCNEKDVYGNCTGGIIQLELNLNHARLEKPIQLTSEFGF